jgi:transporter family protein
MSYVVWALIGMAGYSATTLFVKLATRGHEVPAFNVLAVAVSIVTACVWVLVLSLGSVSVNGWKGFGGMNAVWTVAAGLALAVAVSSLFRALALGPASVVVPIYGMFIVGGAVLGILVLHEPMTLHKGVGILMAVGGVILIAR